MPTKRVVSTRSGSSPPCLQARRRPTRRDESYYASPRDTVPVVHVSCVLTRQGSTCTRDSASSEPAPFLPSLGSLRVPVQPPLKPLSMRIASPTSTEARRAMTSRAGASATHVSRTRAIWARGRALATCITTFVRVHDKGRLPRLCERQGAPHPETAKTRLSSSGERWQRRERARHRSKGQSLCDDLQYESMAVHPWANRTAFELCTVSR